jgi:hypothetical protein
MDRILRCATWSLAVLAALLSPAIVAFGVPFAYGIGSDIIEMIGARPVVLVLMAAAGIIAGRRMLRHRLWNRLPYAAKSMT